MKRIRGKSKLKATGLGRPVLSHKTATEGPTRAQFLARIGDGWLENTVSRDALTFARNVRALAKYYAMSDSEEERARTRATRYEAKWILEFLVWMVGKGIETEFFDQLQRIYRAGADKRDLYPWLEHLPYAYTDAVQQIMGEKPTVRDVCARLKDRGCDPGEDVVRKLLKAWRMPVRAKFGR